MSIASQLGSRVSRMLQRSREEAIRKEAPRKKLTTAERLVSKQKKQQFKLVKLEGLL
jgi:hypothetical protein